MSFTPNVRLASGAGGASPSARGVYVEFRSHEVKISVRAKVVGLVIPIMHHVEGWKQVSRMWRYSFTEWQGAPGWELDIPIMFDRFASKQSVEKEVAKLETLATKMPNQPRTPICQIDAGGAIPHDYTRDHTKRWVIAGIDWSGGGGSTSIGSGSTDHYYINQDNNRVRQLCVITAWEYIPDKLVQINNLIPTKQIPKTYKIRKGDTLMKLAAYFYGDSSKWRDIAKLNNIRDPNHLKVGSEVRLPTS